MRILLRVVLVVFVVSVLVGCPTSECISLYNNSGSAVEIVLPTSNKVLANQESVLIGDNHGDLALEDLTWQEQPDGMRYPTLQISNFNSITNYIIARPELDDMYIGEAVCSAHLKVQLDPDQELYFVPASAGFPVTARDQKVRVSEESSSQQHPDL